MPQTSIEIGLLLQEARESQRLSLAATSAELKIQKKYLRALEEGETDDLPPGIYILGYLKSYADFLKLDSESLIERFKAEQEHQSVSRDLYLPEPYRKEFHPRPMALFVSLLLVVAIYMTWRYTTVSDVNTSGIEQKKADTMVASPDAAIVLLAKADTRIEVLDNAHRVLSAHMLHAGDAYFVAATKEKIVSIDNPAVIDVMKNGKLADFSAIAMSSPTDSPKN